MSSATLTTAGILLITVVAVSYGGLTLLMHVARRKTGYLDNPVRRGLWTAGHAHAGVLVLFALAVLPYVDQADASDGTRTLIRALLVAPPILMPLGFFLSVVRPQDTRPNKLIWLTVAGGASLVAGSLLLGINLL
ncbi:hypothetical protein D7147_28355 [Micromonospora musae]|uniref:Uncharacterized protein n=1 Tax=Micromonospora musae TaxID=1894970 RepID=A0A3A9XZ57_9ACTN|nr:MULTISPECIES: hypothetical protein [Micromonospora]RKN14725.1 hypothetical protein D7147_28355 [Micromonospora musae]RKN29703.1 hypothetical protein D7044_22180 [Micromonospora musae]TYC01867.1 hypothetical protein FXF53_10840 [Micromonospora sp. WP24]